MQSYESFPRSGDVYLVDFQAVGSVQGGRRPCVVLQNDKGNQASPNVVVVPLTSAIKKTGQPTHVLLCASETGLKEDSIALCENPQTVPKQILSTKLTTIPNRDMKRIAESYLLASATLSYFTPKELSAIWEKAVGFTFSSEEGGGRLLCIMNDARRTS